MLVGVAAYAGFAAEPEELHRIRWDGLATMLYVANWREILAGFDYWALFTSPSPLAHTWSLAIEEQFYVLWPLVVLAALAWWRRRHRGARAVEDATRDSFARTMLVVCGGLALVALASQAFWQRTAGWDRVYFGTDTRAFALLCGAALASATVWLRTSAPVDRAAPMGRGRVVLELAGALGAVGLVVAWVFMDGGSWVVRHGGLAACSLAGTAMVAAAAHPRPGIVTRVLSCRPLVGLGLISYGVYLYHWPIAVWLSSDRVGLDGWASTALHSVLTLTVAILSYRLVEQPIRYGARWPRWRVVVAPASGFALVGALLFVGTTSSLPTTDVSEEDLRAAAELDDDVRTVMIVGNSVAWYLAEGFEEVATVEPLRVVGAGQPDCQYPPAEGIRYEDGDTRGGDQLKACDAHWARTVDAYRPDEVIFVRNGLDPTEILVDGTYLRPCTPAFEAHHLAALRADVERFAEAGATTVLVTSPPSHQHLGLTDEYYERYLDAVECGNDVRRQVAESMPDTKLVDLEAYLCTSERTCRRELDGSELRGDGTHFKGRAARLVAAWILNEIGIEASADP